jgi:hypothetical protein
MKLTDYIELVEWSGRQIHNKKKGAISSTLPPILNRLGIESDNWLFLREHFEQSFKNVLSSALSIQRVCVQLQQRWVQGQRECERLFSCSLFLFSFLRFTPFMFSAFLRVLLYLLVIVIDFYCI